jgi:tRNA (cmo5U34)-methyltransferase
MDARNHTNRQNAARVTVLKGAFQKLATGESGRPTKDSVTVSADLIEPGSSQSQFFEVFENFTGVFDRHYLASIPFIYEENCRQGAALVKLLCDTSDVAGRSATLLTLETSEATFARSVVTLSEGRVKSLSTTSTPENGKTFYANQPIGTHLIHIPIFELELSTLSTDPHYNDFRERFDFILEDTAFQMYGPERKEQLEHVASLLHPRGLFVCIEKCLHRNSHEYWKRELQKDNEFKSRFFFIEDIVAKRRDIVNVMKKGQVFFDELVEILCQNFKHCHLIWNSGNFYSFACSNDQSTIKNYLDLLGPPKIPEEFQYEATRSFSTQLARNDQQS